MPTNHFISIQDAQQMISRYRKLKETLLCDEFLNLDVLPDCETFDRIAFDTLLAKDGCTKIRAYIGMDELNKINLVFVAVNQNDEDMVESTLDPGDDIFENGVRCPNICPPDSPLNS